MSTEWTTPRVVTAAAVVVSGLAIAAYALRTGSKGSAVAQKSKSMVQDQITQHRPHGLYSQDKMRQFAAEHEQEFVCRAPVRLVVVGCGNRGSVYATYALEHPERAKVVAVVDPIQFRRESMAKRYGLLPDAVFTNWEDVVARPKFADAVIIATPDAHHAAPAIAFADKGYNLLVEKPMAVTEDDCRKMIEAVKRNNVIMAVGHVLRYTPYTQKIKQLVDSGSIGEVVNIQHLEPVGYWHAAHSYVRGNWHREADSTFMLMAKSCHDVDWIRYMMNKKCKKVSSFGSIVHFKKEKKPLAAGSAKRCLDCGIQDVCPYSAKTTYMKPIRAGFKDWPVSVIVPDSEPDIENVEYALRNGPYGVCVYESDNDVVDNQVVNMEFEGGSTCSFSMVSFTQDVCVRKTRIFGSKGQLEMDGKSIIKTSFMGGGSQETIYADPTPPTRMAGHDGADYYLMRKFIQAVDKNDQKYILSGPDETLESHLIVFKAESARKTGQVINVEL